MFIIHKEEEVCSVKQKPLCLVFLAFMSWCSFMQEGESFVKKIGAVFAFKVKGGPDGKEALWVVDVKNGKGSVDNNSGVWALFPPLKLTGV